MRQLHLIRLNTGYTKPRKGRRRDRVEERRVAGKATGLLGNIFTAALTFRAVLDDRVWLPRRRASQDGTGQNQLRKSRRLSRFRVAESSEIRMHLCSKLTIHDYLTHSHPFLGWSSPVFFWL